MSVHRFDTAAAAAQACAKFVLERLHPIVAMHRVANLAVSGGESPKVMFEYFARAVFPWERVHVFWVDERGVPPGDAQSNFKMAAETWLVPSQFPAENIHRIQGELEPQEAAQLYREEIRKHFRLREGELPRFDVVHQGMGPDAHTASLFPGLPLLDDGNGIAAAAWVEKADQWRITLLPGVLQAAQCTAMLVVGQDKAPMLRAAFEEPYDPHRYPVQVVMRNACLEWFVDKPAAAELKG